MVRRASRRWPHAFVVPPPASSEHVVRHRRGGTRPKVGSPVMANISGAARGATRRGGRQALAAALVVAAGCGVLASGAGAAPGPRSSGFGSNWTVYHGNDLSTGLDPAGTVISPLRSAWRSPALDGSLFGEPLVYGGRVVIATTNDTIYEL